MASVKMHVKKGDEVVVISGGAKGRRGKVARVLRERRAVILEGSDERSKGGDARSREMKAQGASETEMEQRRLVKPVLHYLRKSNDRPQGGLLWLEGPIDASNVMKAEDFEARAARRQK
jgi:ribosomal protein L24